MELTAVGAGTLQQVPVPLRAPCGAAVPGSALAPLCPHQQPLAVHKHSDVLDRN